MKAIKKISTKLLLAFAVVLALVMALGYSSLTAIGGLGGALDVAVNGTAKKLRLVGDLQAGFQEMRVDAAKLEISLTNTIIGRLDTRQGSAESTCGSCHTSDTVETQRQQFEAVAARLSAQVAQLRPLVAGDGERQAAHTVETGIAEMAGALSPVPEAHDHTRLHRGARGHAGPDLSPGREYGQSRQTARGPAAGTPGGVQPGGPRARFRQPRGRVRSHRAMPPGGGRRVLDGAGCESSFAAIRR